MRFFFFFSIGSCQANFFKQARGWRYAEEYIFLVHKSFFSSFVFLYCDIIQAQDRRQNKIQKPLLQSENRTQEVHRF